MKLVFQENKRKTSAASSFPCTRLLQLHPTVLHPMTFRRAFLSCTEIISDLWLAVYLVTYELWVFSFISLAVTFIKIIIIMQYHRGGIPLFLSTLTRTSFAIHNQKTNSLVSGKSSPINNNKYIIYRQIHIITHLSKFESER